MTKNEKVLLAAALLVCVAVVIVGFLVLYDTQEPLAPGGDISTADRGSQVRSSDAASSDENIAPLPEEREAMEPASDGVGADASGAARRIARGIIIGRVLSEFNEPVADVAVERDRDTITINIGGDEAGNTKRDSGAGSRDKTDREGRFRLEGIGAAESVRLQFSHPDFIHNSITIKPYDGSMHDTGDVILVMGGSISGYVSDTSGRAVAGAEVCGRPTDTEGGTDYLSFSSIVSLVDDDSGWKAKTDEEGFYKITGIPPGKADIKVSHHEYQNAEINGVEVSRGLEKSGVNFVLKPGYVIAGRVVDVDNRPLEGVAVNVQAEVKVDLANLDALAYDLLKGSGENVKTDSDGYFQVVGLKKDVYTVRAQIETHLPFKKEKVEAGTADLLVVLREGGWLTGWVLDARTGLGVESFTMDVDVEDEGVTEVRVLKGKEALAEAENPEDARGAFRIEGLGAEYDLLVQAEGYADQQFEGLASEPAQGDELSIRLIEESTVSGRVVDLKGDPVADAKVTIERPQQQTDDAGEPVTIPIPNEGRTVTLDPRNRWDRVKHVRTAEDGSFKVKGMTEGYYRALASHDEYLRSDAPEFDLSQGEHKEGIELRLGQAGMIAGIVYDVDGKPLPGAGVFVMSGGGIFSILATAMSDESAFDLKNTTSDSEGRYMVKGLAPGSYKVQLIPSMEEECVGGIANMGISGVLGTGGPGMVEAYVKAGEVTELDLYVPLKGAISGTLLEAGRPVKGMKIKLFNAGLGFLALIPLKTTTSDDDGAFLFKNLVEGAYELHLDLDGHSETLKELVELKAGGLTVHDIALPSGRVSGRVTDEAGKPLSGIKVSLERGSEESSGLFGGFSFNVSVNESQAGTSVEDGDITEGISGPRPVRTNKDGRFEIAHVKAGEYKLVASGEGYAENERGAVIVRKGAKTTGQDIALTRE